MTAKVEQLVGGTLEMRRAVREKLRVDPTRDSEFAILSFIAGFRPRETKP